MGNIAIAMAQQSTLTNQYPFVFKRGFINTGDPDSCLSFCSQGFRSQLQLCAKVGILFPL